jgi:hypothetical protein
MTLVERFEALKMESRKYQALWVVPSVIGMVCYMRDAGPIVDGIIRHIGPFYDAICRRIAGFFGVGWIGPFLIILFMLPSGLFGLYDILNRKKWSLGPFTSYIGCFGFWLVYITGVTFDLSIDGLIAAIVFGSVTYLLSVFLSLNLRKFGHVYSIVPAVVGSIIFVMSHFAPQPFFPMLYLYDPSGDLIAIIVITIWSFVIALALFDIRRMRDVAIIVISLFVISKLSQFVVWVLDAVVAN